MNADITLYGRNSSVRLSVSDYIASDDVPDQIELYATNTDTGAGITLRVSAEELQQAVTRLAEIAKLNSENHARR